MGLESFLDKVTANAQDHAVWISVWGFAVVAAVALTWWKLPPIAARVLHWIDEILPGDFSDLHAPIARWTSLGVSVAVLAFGISEIYASLLGDGPRPYLLASVAVATGWWLLTTGLKLAIVIGAGLFARRLLGHVIPRVVERHLRGRAGERLDTEIEKDVLTLSSVLAAASSVVVLGATFFMLMAQVGIDLAPLLVGLGVVGIAVAFGAQNLVRDVFAGIFIILENQYRVNDVVNIAGIGGLVEDINLRRTVLRDLDYRQHFIPNGEIRTASNYTKDKSRVNINIGVAYKEDLEQVIEVLNRVGLELSRDPEWGPLVLDPIQVLRVDAFADSAIEIKVLGETVPIRQWDIAGQYRLRVKKAFDELGIEIPFPHRTLYWGEGEPNVMQHRQVRPEEVEGADGEARVDGRQAGQTPAEANPDPEGAQQAE